LYKVALAVRLLRSDLIKLILANLIKEHHFKLNSKDMKKRYWFPLLILIAIACSEDNSSSNSKSDVVNTATSGIWRITYFYDTDSDETANFTGYAFTFGASDVLTATKGSTTQTGIWSVSDSNSNDDSIDDLHFNIAFTIPPDFEELSDDWDIIEYTSTKIRLVDVSGGSGGTDYLTFEKN
jgi:hypothetical protein